jgi:hypothetical protein
VKAWAEHPALPDCLGFALAGHARVCENLVTAISSLELEVEVVPRCHDLFLSVEFELVDLVAQLLPQAGIHVDHDHDRQCS